MKDKELYHFMMGHECGVCFDKKEKRIEAWVHVGYEELSGFLDIIEPKYESYPMAELQENSVCVHIHEIIEPDSCIDEFEKCFDAADWKVAKEEYENYCEGQARGNMRGGK